MSINSRMTGVVAFIVGAIFSIYVTAAAAEENRAVVLDTCFTPGDNCLGFIMRQLETAQKEILVQAYSFTQPDIVKSLVDAKKRGVQVSVILDESNVCDRQERACTARNKGQIAIDILLQAGIDVRIDDRHRIAHNKVMLIDGVNVLTGSYNFTQSAQSYNAENIIYIRNQPEQLYRYWSEWRNHWSHSRNP